MLAVLKRVVQLVNAASSLDEALELVVKELRDALHADAASIFLVDDEKGEYVLMATVGLNAEQVGKFRLPYSKGLIGLVGERGEPLNIEDAPSHPNFFRAEKLVEHPYSAFLGVPIMHGGDLLGILLVQQKQSRAFAEDEESFMVTLSAQLAGEIAHSQAKGKLTELSNKGKKRSKAMVVTGVVGSPGVAIGQGVTIYPPADLDSVPDRPVEDADKEYESFKLGLNAARKEINELNERAKKSLSPTEQALFEAYIGIMSSRSFKTEIKKEIKDGRWAQAALRQVIKLHVLQFESLEDEYLRERAADFRDIGRRILAHMQSKQKVVREFPKQTILIGDEITATNLMEIAEGQLAGILSRTGSSNSHVAILARAMGVPAVMGVEGTPLEQLDQKSIILDGYNGEALISPSNMVKKEYRALMEEEKALDSELENLRDLPAATEDGCEISLMVNTGLASDVKISLDVGAEGIGLYRTEIPFMVRDRFPSEAEQRVLYRQILTGFNPKSVVMRTLDIGGDKALPYFPVEEPNPFLGWRGIRISLDHPELFLQQIRAMLRANVGLDNLQIMLPMISSVSEVEAAKSLIKQAFDELVEDGVALIMPPLGVMIEVPAAVYQIRTLAKHVEFFSVGSNDLIQYLLAVDRNNARVANLYQGLHPAVLQSLASVAKDARAANRRVAICGEMAGDPVIVILLLAMGYHSLSMSARSLPRIKWVIRSFSMTEAKALLKEVMAMDDPVEIRVHLEMALDKKGLGGLIRAGK